MSDGPRGGSGGSGSGQCGCGCRDGKRCGGDEYASRQYRQHRGAGVYPSFGAGEAFASGPCLDVGRAVGSKKFSRDGAEWKDVGNFRNGEDWGRGGQTGDCLWDAGDGVRSVSIGGEGTEFAGGIDRSGGGSASPG